jgi:hypothetical protein
MPQVSTAFVIGQCPSYAGLRAKFKRLAAVRRLLTDLRRSRCYDFGLPGTLAGIARKVGRAVECTGLEIRRVGNGTVSSNLTPSAIQLISHLDLAAKAWLTASSARCLPAAGDDITFWVSRDFCQLDH